MPDSKIGASHDPGHLSGDGPGCRWILSTTIFVVFLALVVAALQYWLARRERNRHRDQMSAMFAMEKSLEAYKTDFGEYPPSPNKAFVRAVSTLNPKAAPYYQFSAWEISVAGAAIDAWGNPLIYRTYRRPGTTGNPRYNLYSIGPNGRDDGGSGDDIFIGS